MSSAAGASKAARHLRIEQQHNSIKGTYAISPSVPDGTGPPVFDMPLETDRQEYASSARFESVTSAVNVEVNVFGDGYGHGNGKGKEVSVMAKSRNGNVKIVVVSDMHAWFERRRRVLFVPT